MIQVKLKSSISSIKAATATDLGVYEQKLKDLPKRHQAAAKAAGFSGKVGTSVVVTSEDGSSVEVLVGLGDRKKFDFVALRTAAETYAKAVRKHDKVATTLVDFVASKLPIKEAVEAVTQGFRLSAYRYTTEKGKGHKPEPSTSVATIVSSDKNASKALDQANGICDAIVLARDLGNGPGGSITPLAFASTAKKVGTEAGLKVTVWDKARIKKEKLGGVLAVNQGSEIDPRLVRLEYVPNSAAKRHVVLVGKGVTFDSGGLSLKSGKGMMTMKIDMAGGAAVFAAMTCLARLRVGVRVTGIIPLTDNMTGGLAQRPGDVYTARNGKTVEVLNTDAEGRLILSDALSLAAEMKPDAIIDIATLTGAASVALGSEYAAVMANDEAVAKKITDGATAVGELMWPMPLPSQYRKQLDSEIADIKNIGSGSFGGALTAGLFLSEFVDDVPWAHIDLGLSAFADGPRSLTPKGATGVGVRTLIEVLATW